MGTSSTASEASDRLPYHRAPMLVWMDLEMTGLDPDSDVIVEIATLVTDDDLAIVAEGPDLVIHQPPEVLARAKTSKLASLRSLDSPRYSPRGRFAWPALSGP